MAEKSPIRAAHPRLPYYVSTPPPPPRVGNSRSKIPHDIYSLADFVVVVVVVVAVLVYFIEQRYYDVHMNFTRVYRHLYAGNILSNFVLFNS